MTSIYNYIKHEIESAQEYNLAIHRLSQVIDIPPYNSFEKVNDLHKWAKKEGFVVSRTHICSFLLKEAFNGLAIDEAAKAFKSQA